MPECELSSLVDSVCLKHGYTAIKEEQKRAIINFVSGKDVFVCLPTGFGKSLCFIILPEVFDTVYRKPEGSSIIIVVAPLTSLMKDQVKMCIVRGIKAVAVTREEESKQNFHRVVNRDYQIVYISPEMILGTRKWRYILQEDIYQSRLCALVVDEAHCVKKWSVRIICFNMMHGLFSILLL